MWFIGVEVEQETSAPPPKKKSVLDPPLNMTVTRNPFKTKEAPKKPSLKIYPSSWISVLIKRKVIPRYNKL